MKKMQKTLFDDFFEEEAMTRIKKFSKICEKLNVLPVVGFSGGKDSQVVYDLCKRAQVPFKTVFNHCFESNTTLKFIRENYPEVEWRREVKEGFFENIRKNHHGYLPTVEAAYCCADYKHNPKFVDFASIVGIRKEESPTRAQRKTLETKTKRFLKKNKETFLQYFSESCIASGAPSEIQLKPILDWTSEDVWNYIKKYNLPINPEYSGSTRVGCLICPKANLTANFKALIKFPKLIDAVIRAREKSNNENIDWKISNLDADFSEKKIEYVCRWLNHSFRPLTEKQENLMEKIIDNYNFNKHTQ